MHTRAKTTTCHNSKSTAIADTNNNDDSNEFDCDDAMKCHNYYCYYCISNSIPQ